MGLFNNKDKENEAAKSSGADNPLVTYRISQALSGKLNAKPEPADPSTHHSFTISLTRPKSFRETIAVSVHCDDTGDDVGHCMIQVVQSKFLDFKYGRPDSTAETDVTLKRHGVKDSSYTLDTADGARTGYRWVHDLDAPGTRTKADRRLRLDDAENNVIARFAGSEGQLHEFGVLEVYREIDAQDADWCGLILLTAICAFAREERSREKTAKINGVVGVVNSWGGLLTMIPLGPLAAAV